MTADELVRASMNNDILGPPCVNAEAIEGLALLTIYARRYGVYTTDPEESAWWSWWAAISNPTFTT